MGKLIYLYDDNKITIEGSTDIAFTEDVEARFRAYGWQVLRVESSEDVDAMQAAIEEAKADTMHPSLIIVRTHIGFGSRNRTARPAMASRWVVKHWRLPKKKPAGRRKCSMYLLRLKNSLAETYSDCISNMEEICSK